MGLEKAHEGYEYQDLLAAFFILKEIVAESDSEFFIDKKEFQGDRIDDFRITNKSGRQKIQIKYSGDADHTFQKGDIAGDAVYGIALDKLRLVRTICEPGSVYEGDRTRSCPSYGMAF